MAKKKRNVRLKSLVVNKACPKSDKVVVFRPVPITTNERKDDKNGKGY